MLVLVAHTVNLLYKNREDMLRIGNLNLKTPIIQGGMGIGVSLSGLAAAVANEGGIGVISAVGLGLFYTSPTEKFDQACLTGLRQEIRKARAASPKGVIGVNIMVALTNYADLARVAIEEKADVIISGAGLPSDLPSFLQPDSTTKLIPIVSSGRAAKIIFDKWKNNYNYIPDAVILEGPEAGGHLGYKRDQLDDEAFSLESLLPEVLAVTRAFEEKYDCKIPVIAAGGIYTGKDMARIMSLGASGVQMGTLFVTTEECDASQAFKQTYIDSKKEDMVIIQSPVGMPGRAIRNDFIDKIATGDTVPKACGFHCIKTCRYPETPYCILLSLFNAYKGNFDKGYAFAGSNAFRAERIKTVKETINEVMVDFDAAQQETGAGQCLKEMSIHE